MYDTKTLKEKIKLFFIIFFPIFITQICLSLMNFFDATMSGQYSPYDLAGVAIGGSIWFPVYTGLNGILLAVTPIVSQLNGSKQHKKIPNSIHQAIYVALMISLLIICLGIFFLKPVLNMMNLDPTVHSIAYQYLVAVSFGVVPLLIFNVMRCFIDALGNTRITMLILLTAIPIKLLTNYVLIYGKFGFPELGGIGAGISTCLTYWLVFLIVIFIVHKKQPFSQYQIFKRVYKISFKHWKELILIGLPIGLAIFFEASIFSAVTILMSKFDTFTIAANQAAINFTGILYMMPLSISMALTILVAYEVGAKRFKDAKVYSWLGISIAVFISTFSATILFLFRNEIAAIYTKEPEVLSLIASFLLFALFFQVSDALQASVQGALRGYKDVNITFITTLIAYWVVGLPLGYYLANYTDLGPYGYWYGLITGLTCGAIGVGSRLILIQRKKFNPKRAH